MTTRPGAATAIIGGEEREPPPSLEWRNWHAHGVRKLRAGGHIVPERIVLHESVTSTWGRAVDVLFRRHLGVHVVVARDGTVTQHADLVRRCAHAGRAHNRYSVAVEVVNRYYGKHASPEDVVIDAVWAHKGRYIVPPHVQLESVWQTVRWLTAELGLLVAFPALQTNDGFLWGRAPAEAREPGIVAHHRTGHADGLVPEHYCLCRSRGAGPAIAYFRTVQAARSAARRTTSHHALVYQMN